MTLLLDFAARSSVVLAAGLLINASLAKRSAALRHRVLAGSMLAAVLVIPFSLALPEWNVTLSTASSQPSRGVLVSSPSEEPLSTSGNAAGSLPAPAIPEPARAARIEEIAAGIWLAGFLAAVSWLAAGLIRVRRMTAAAAPVTEPAWLQTLDEVARRYGITRRISITRAAKADMLATWGVLRPRVMVPRGSRDWPLERVRVVLCHELAHIRRHDWVVQMVAGLLRAVLWLNPLAWIVCARLRRESEQACDDEVLAVGVGGGDYAAHLIDLARQCRRSGSTWASVLPMAHPSTLERRVIAMLNPRLDRQSPSRRAIATLVAVLLLVTLPAAALRARQAGPAPLTGTIYDVSGGVMPGVEVALIDAAETKRVATSVATGRFEFPAVAPGKYVLAATLPGFGSLRQEITLAAATDWQRAIIMQIGELRESISVSASRLPAGSAGAAPAAPVRIGGSVRAPRKIFDVKPEYPASMRAAGLSGVVPIEAVIGRDGSVSAVRVMSAQAHPDLAAAAVDAVRRWRFQPTMLNGVAVDVVMTVSVRFDLQ